MLGIRTRRGLLPCLVLLVIVALAAPALAGVTGPATIKTVLSANDLNLTNVVKASNFTYDDWTATNLTIGGVVFDKVLAGQTVNGVTIDGNGGVSKNHFVYKAPMTEFFGAMTYGAAGTTNALKQTGLIPGNYKVQLLLYEWSTAPGRTLDISVEGGLPTSYTVPNRPAGSVWSQVVAVEADLFEFTGTLNVDVTCATNTSTVSGMLVSTTTESPGAATSALVDDPSDLDLTNLVSATNFGTTQGTIELGDVTFYGCFSAGAPTVQGVSSLATGRVSSVQTGAVVDIPIENLYGSSVVDQTPAKGGDGILNVGVEAAPGSYELDLLLYDDYAYDYLASYDRNVDITVEGTMVATKFNYYENQGFQQQGVLMTVPVTLGAGDDGKIDVVIDRTAYPGFTDATAPMIAGLVLRSVGTVQIPGDANGDGKVNAADAQSLATNWGVIGGATWAMGDFNGDFAINAADASIMAANWGYGTSEASAGTVPEPATVSMLLAAALLGLAARRFFVDHFGM